MESFATISVCSKRGDAIIAVTRRNEQQRSEPRIMYRRVPTLFVLLITVHQLFGQGDSGVLVGLIRDISGNAVASAKVGVRMEGSAATQSALSSPDGRFAFTRLDLGTYTVTIESAGFKTQTLHHVVVASQRRTIVNFVLDPITPGRRSMVSEGKNSDPFSADPAFFDELQLKPGTFKDSMDAGGYSSEAQAQTSRHLLRGVGRLKSDSPNSQNGTKAGVGSADQEAFRRTEAELQQAVAREPDSFESNYHLAEFYLNSGKIEAGIPYLEIAQRLNPTHYASGYDLALAYLETHNYTKARAKLQEMLRRQENAELHNLMGEAEESSGNSSAAAREFQRAAQMDPNEKNIFDWGNELLLHRAYEPAVEVLSHGVERYPNSAKLHIALGVALDSRGQYDDAVNALIEATDLEPNDPRPYQFLGKMFDISLAKADQVTKRLERFSQLQPTNALANYYYGMSIWKGRRTQSSQETLKRVEVLLKRAEVLDPRFPDAHVQLANLYASQQKVAEAIREYQRAIQLQPEVADTHYRLAQLYARIGEKTRAQEEFALHDRLHKRQQEEEERKRREMGQFEYSIEGSSKP
jgi:tetratricopeptide (TPR) repeat protein